MTHVARQTGRGAIGLFLALLILASGCAGPDTARLQGAKTSYGQGDYAAAYRDASRLADDPDSDIGRGVANEAAYVAGLAAHRQKDYPAAQRYLSRAAQSTSSRTAASASAALGLLYSEQARYEQAAKAFLDAADNLTGQDRANAYFWAAVAQQKLGRWEQAKANLGRAVSYNTDPILRQRIVQQVLYDAFTLQLGAYENAALAQAQAQRYAPSAAQLGLGKPQLVTASNPNQRPMVLVQVGRFASYGAAADARARLGFEGALVVPVDTDGR